MGKGQVSFEGIVSGYLGSPSQIHKVLYFLERFHGEDTIFLADPVMGDNGRCIKIFTDELLDSMRRLTKKANVITPNLTELCLLAGEDYQNLVAHKEEKTYLERIRKIAEDLLAKAEREQTIIVTGILRQKADGE